MKSAPQSASDRPQARDLGGAHWVRAEISWHRTQSRRAVYVALMLAIVTVGLVVINGVLLMERPTPVYFATSSGGRITQLTPLNEPVISQAGLMNWTAAAVAKTLSIDFANYRAQLSGVRGDYLPAAYNEVISGLVSSGNLRMIRAQRLAVSATVSQAPVLVAKGFIGHVLAWKIQFPVIVSYQSSQGVSNTQNLVATVVVERAPLTEYPRGIAIAQLVLAQSSS